MSYLHMGLALIAGLIIPVQIGLNTNLAERLGHSILATVISFAVGFSALFMYSLSARLIWPPVSELTRIPWWMWCGGMIGAFVVWVSVFSGPKIGAMTLLATFLAGQLVASIVIDHYGLLGFPIRPLSWERALGVVLLVTGVYLIRKY